MKSFSITRLLAVAGLFLALIAVGSGVGPAHAASLSTGTAAAASSLQISPAKQTQYVAGGQTYVFYYKLSNNSLVAADLPVKLAVASNQGWKVAISPAETTVPAKTTAEFKVAVSVPQLATSNRSLVKITAF